MAFEEGSEERCQYFGRDSIKYGLTGRSLKVQQPTIRKRRWKKRTRQDWGKTVQEKGRTKQGKPMESGRLGHGRDKAEGEEEHIL